MSISSEIAKEMLKLFPDKCRVIKVKMLYEKEVRKYLMETEKAHKRAAKSKLHFGYQNR